MNPVGVLTSVFVLAIVLAIFFWGVVPTLSDWLTPKDTTMHYMKIHSDRTYCGKPRKQVRYSTADWGQVGCADCLKNEPKEFTL